jgi:HME family heavy-metal exporter
MLNQVIRFALRQPLLIVALAALVIAIGLPRSRSLPIDVFPDLDRPRVVVLTEAEGLAPEEVERLINIPLESVLNGAPGVEAVRASAAAGISVIYVEFAWGTDIFIDRQVVNERLAVVANRLPPGVQPQLAPIASIMGQIMLVGMYVDGEHDDSGQADNDQAENAAALGDRTSMLELRQIADWTVRRRLMNVQGVAQVFVMGGERGGQRQVQVLVDPDRLRQAGVTLHEVELALLETNANTSGGYVDIGPQRLLVRSLGRIESLDDLRSLVVDSDRQPAVLLHQVAEVKNGPEVPLGRAAVNDRPAVMLTIVKQPGTDTRQLTEHLLAALDEMESTLPSDVRIEPHVYRMDTFIDRAIDNVLEALRDGGVLVVIVLVLFLLNARTTFITLTAIPLSIFLTVLVFAGFGLTINTMTLGGLAVAIGELVDDAIVDVENIYRRLKENRHAAHPRNPIAVIFQASVEVRNSIVFGTMIVVLVFVPLFALGGIEGRLFTPLGIAYIVSILASLLVSLTVTPVLSYLLLARRWVWPCLAVVLVPAIAIGGAYLLVPEWTWWGKLAAAAIAMPLLAGGLLLLERFSGQESDGPLLRWLKWLAERTIAYSLRHRWLVLGSAAAAAAIAVVVLASLGRNFMPPFNEGAVQVSVMLPPGTSLEESDRIGRQIDRALLDLDFVTTVGRRTGRAEEDEHVAGVNYAEILIELDPRSERSREEQVYLIRHSLDDVPGVESDSGRTESEQPIAHLMSHMLSGVKSQIAIKIYGDDLAVLRKLGQEAKAAMSDVPGVVDLALEPQVLVSQIQIRPDDAKLAQLGLRPGDVNHLVETAMNGRVISQVLEGDAAFDLVVRLDDEHRRDLAALANLAVPLPSGGSVALSEVAQVLPDRAGPNEINREDRRRRIVVQCNVSGRALSDVRDEIEVKLAPLTASLPTYGRGYAIQYGGQFESEQAATRVLLLLSIVAAVGIFLLLYTLFRSANLALQVMAALPMAAIGAVAALIVTGQDLSVPSMVGFISLGGIASRNGILLMAHYLHLVRYEGEGLTQGMVIRAGKERLAPVLMTALTSGIGLVPLAMAAGQPGKEILYPVATVIIGGLISSTLLEFLVRPALFWSFGRKAAERVLAHSADEQPWTVEPVHEPAAATPVP